VITITPSTYSQCSSLEHSQRPLSQSLQHTRIHTCAPATGSFPFPYSPAFQWFSQMYGRPAMRNYSNCHISFLSSSFITKIPHLPSQVPLLHWPIPSSLLGPVPITRYRCWLSSASHRLVSNYTPVSPTLREAMIPGSSFPCKGQGQEPVPPVTAKRLHLRQQRQPHFTLLLIPCHVNKDECGTAKNTAEDRYSPVFAFCMASKTVCVEVTRRSPHPFI